MKKIYVALITPFFEDGSIDYEFLRFLIHKLIKEGCSGFVVCGTTAEAPTLEEEEKFLVLEFVIKEVNGEVDVIFGCGTNNTLETLKLVKKANLYAIDGLLIVTPYYNLPNQDGLFQHYSLLAQNSNLSIILYQVENRCNCVFEIETLKRLKDSYPNIIALKYASKNLEYAKQIKNAIPSLKLYCGIDALIDECDKLGMNGVISVIGHVCMNDLVRFYNKKEKNLDFKFKEMSSKIFIQSNPIGIKYALSKFYGMNDIVRLPLTCLNKEDKEILNHYFDNL